MTGFLFMRYKKRLEDSNYNSIEVNRVSDKLHKHYKKLFENK